MLKKLASFTILLMLASVVSGVAPTMAQYPACSDVQGGNVTFLICQGYTIDHFWSGSKIIVDSQDGASAEATITNDHSGYQDKVSLYLNSSQTVKVDNRESREISLTLTYLGSDNLDPDRALIKVDSNTTYDDSFYVPPSPQPEPQPQPSPEPQPQPEPVPVPTSTLLSPIHVSVSALYGNDPAKPLFDVTWDKLLGAEKFELTAEKKNSSSSYESFFSFTDYVADLNTPGFVGVILPEKGEFRLKVRGVNSVFGVGPWSEYVNFVNSVSTTPQPQPEPKLTAPNLYISQVYQNSNGDYLVDLNWDKIAGANYYYLVVDAQGNGYVNSWETSDGYYMYDWRLGLTDNKLISYQLGSLGSPTNYRFEVMAYKNNVSENNPWSNYAYASQTLAYSATTGQIKVQYELTGGDWYLTSGEAQITYKPDGIITDYEKYKSNLWEFEFMEGSNSPFFISPSSGQLNLAIGNSIHKGGLYKLNNFNDAVPNYWTSGLYSQSVNNLRVGDSYVYYGEYLGMYFKVKILEINELSDIYLPVPTIYRPTSSEQMPFDPNWQPFTTTSLPQIEWYSVSGADTYRVVLDKYDSIFDVYESYKIWGPYVYTNDFAMNDLFLPGYGVGAGKYRTKIKAYSTSGRESIWSDYTYFGIYNTNTIKLAMPTTTYPSNNEKIYHNKYDSFYYGHDITERQLNTTWNSVSGADSYTIDYEKKDGQGQWLGYYQFTVYGTYDLLYGWIDTGEYRVRLKSQDSAGVNTDSDWSAWTYFTVYDHGSKTSTSTTGVDGTYVGYKNLAITHTPTGITATVAAYDHAVVYLSLTGADSNLIYVKKNSSYYAISADGTKLLRFYFDKIDDNGVTLRLETKNLSSPTSPTSTSTTSG